MAALTVVLHYRRTATYGLNVLLGALDAELGSRDGLEVVAASGLDAALSAAGDAIARDRQVLVAWSFYSPELVTVAGELARFRREVTGPVRHVCGGVHASAEPMATLDLGFDLVVVGEGEQPFVELVGALLEDRSWAEVAGLAWAGDDAAGAPGTPGTLVRTGPAPRLPLGRYPAFAAARGRFNPIEITRGCVYGCTFCQTPYLFKARFRHRPVDDVARHAAQLVGSGRRDVRFVTPTALSYGSPDESVDLAAIDTLLGEVRAAAGRHARVFFGTFPSEVRPEHVTPEALAVIRRWCDNDNLIIGGQSGSEDVLARTNRGHGVEVIVDAVRHTAAAGLVPNVDLLFGLPGEGADELTASLDLAERLAALGARVHGHTFMPLPGTPLRDGAAGSLDDAVRARLDRLASSGALYGSWRRQEEVAAQLVALRPPRRRARGTPPG